MYLIDEILPKIPTMIPEIIKEDEPINKQDIKNILNVYLRKLSILILLKN